MDFICIICGYTIGSRVIKHEFKNWKSLSNFDERGREFNDWNIKFLYFDRQQRREIGQKDNFCCLKKKN